MRTRDQIRLHIESLRSRRPYRLMIVTMRLLILAFPVAALAWWLQYTSVPKPIVGVLFIGAVAVGVIGGLVYIPVAMFLAIEQSVKARSLYDPTADLEFTKVFLVDLVRPVLRRRRA